MTRKLAALGAAMATCVLATAAQAAGSNTAAGTYVLTNPTYTQDFDRGALTPLGSNLTTSPPGWQFYEGGPSGDGFYVGGVSNTNGGMHAYGSGTNSTNAERALGGIPSSGMTPLHFGVFFQNALGGTIDSLTINYTGEQWYSGSTQNVMRFEYSLNAADINDLTGIWTAFTALDFTGPVTWTRDMAVNGNLLGNYTELSGTISGLSIAAGQTFALRWVLNDMAPVNEDGLAVDDLTVTANVVVAAVPEPATWAMMIGGFGVAGAALRRRRSNKPRFA